MTSNLWDGQRTTRDHMAWVVKNHAVAGAKVERDGAYRARYYHDNEGSLIAKSTYSPTLGSMHFVHLRF